MLLDLHLRGFHFTAFITNIVTGNLTWPAIDIMTLNFVLVYSPKNFRAPGSFIKLIRGYSFV